MPGLIDMRKSPKVRGGLSQDLGHDVSIKDVAPRPVSKIVAKSCNFNAGDIAFCDL